MSRHRQIRNMNIDDELDDDALSDGGDEMTPEQHEQMINGLEQIRQVIGDEEVSGLSDQSIQEMLWDSYFDVERTVQWAIAEQERRQAAQQRKDGPSQHLPSTSPGQPHYYDHEYSYPPEDSPAEDGGYPTVRSRLPLIVQAQQQQGGIMPVPDSPIVGRLSTISEKSERTELSPYVRPRLLGPPPRRPINSSPATSYGQVINDHMSEAELPNTEPIDPNLIPVSPSGSAMQRLSLYEPPPSNSTSEARSSQSTPRPPSVPIPRMEAIPDIPDFSSKSSKPLPIPAPTQFPLPKKSKLAALASSRASSITSLSESSAAGTALTGSIRTFPVLRPSSQSAHPPSSNATPSVVSKSLPPVPSASSTSPSSTSAHVRRAIEAAIELEALDRKTPTPTNPVSPLPEVSDRFNTITPGPSRLAAPTPSRVAQGPPISPCSPPGRPVSKLALLAQAKQSRADLSRAPRLPKTTTEYLTPIANGSSVTTAITTSYQSLYSLTDPSRPAVIPRLNIVPLGAASLPDNKQSKLAMKIKKAHEKLQPDPTKLEEEIASTPVSPMFYPIRTRARASPSAFASLLVNENLTSLEGNEKGSPNHRSKRSKQKESGDVLLQDALPSNRRRKAVLPPPVSPSTFSFDGPSPDDLVFNARRGTALAQQKGLPSPSPLARELEKSQRLAQQKNAALAVSSSHHMPSKPKKNVGSNKGEGLSMKVKSSAQELDIAGLNLDEKYAPVIPEEPPKVTYGREKLLDEAKRLLDAKEKGGQKGVSIIVIGHVDAGKSTLMGRLLYELGRLDEKTRNANERGSSKAGKSSFSWAWGLDGTAEERERGITMDIAVQSLSTLHRQITVLDAPGHKDFIPNMISGAAQADCALLVVDAATGEFEAGFDRGGQTREHLILVRSLGVNQVIVAINKLDQVNWSKDRYDSICALLRPFLVQSGFQPSKVQFVPVGAIQGVNLATQEGKDAEMLRQWYSGPTLVDFLDKLEPPTRDIMAPLRIPISNAYRSQSAGIAASGRLCGGIVQVGERLRILPGEETAAVKLIEVEEESVPWAVAGSYATLYLTGVDILNIGIGSVLCPQNNPVPLATRFTARIIVFDIQVPITAGASVEIYHHSRDVPASMTKLISTIDRATGSVVKLNPRVLSKGTSAEVQIALRSLGGPAVRGIPVEPFSINKDMGRILIRRGGETIAAGVVIEING